MQLERSADADFVVESLHVPAQLQVLDIQLQSLSAHPFVGFQVKNDIEL